MAMQEMFPAMVNSVATALSGGIGANDTVFYVLDDSRIPDPPNLLVLGENSAMAETVKLTAKVGAKLTVIRGFQGAARSWDAGTTVSRNFTAYDHDAFKENIEMLDAVQSGLNSKADAINAKADEILSGVSETSAKTDILQTGLVAVRTELTDIKTITNSVSGKIGEDSNSAESSGTTLFSLLKYVVSMFVSHFTSTRAAKLDNLDVAVSTRVAQTSVDFVQAEIAEIKSIITGLKPGGGVNVMLTIPKISFNTPIDYYEQLPVVIEREGMAAFDVSDDVVYLIGGHNRAGQCDGGVFTLRLSSGTLERKASMPTRRINAGIAFDKEDGVIYVVGGKDYRGLTSDVVEAYNIATNTWTSLPSLATSREGCKAVVYDGNLYCIGGRLGNSRAVDMVSMLNLATRTWTELPSMATPRFLFGMSIVGGEIICMGGETQRGISRTHDRLSIRTNTWSSFPDMNHEKANFDIAMFNGILCCVGDREGEIFFHILAANKWPERQRRETGANAAGLERSDGVYTFGGRLQNGSIGAPITKTVPGRMRIAPVEAGDIVWDTAELYTETQRIQAQTQTVVTNDGFIYSDSDHEYGWIRKGGF